MGAPYHDRGMGAVSLRPLGMGGAVGLDVGRRRPMGLRAVPLRPLGVLGRRLGLGAGPARRAAGVRTRARRVRGRGGAQLRRAVVTVRPGSAVTTREVVVRREPPPPPVPFMARQRALRTHPGRPLDETTLGTLRRQSPPDRTKPLVRPAVPVATQDRPTSVLRPTREGLPPPRALAPPAPAERAPPVDRPAR